MKITHERLSKTNWKTLSDVGLTDGGYGNGFADTTKKFDDNIICVKGTETFIYIKNTWYVVQYISGCFYPVWFKAGYGVNEATIKYSVDKNGIIININ